MIMVAVLLANSVKQAKKAVIKITAAAGGTSAKGWRWPPIQEASPDSSQALAIAKPPPSNRMIFQGTES